MPVAAEVPTTGTSKLYMYFSRFYHQSHVLLTTSFIALVSLMALRFIVNKYLPDSVV